MSDSTLPTEQPFTFPSLDWGFLLATAEWLAARTETKVDDAAVDFLRVVASDPTVAQWLGSQIEYAETQPPGTLSFTADPPEEVVEALRAGGIFKTARDAGEIVTALKEFLPVIVTLVQAARMFIK